MGNDAEIRFARFEGEWVLRHPSGAAPEPGTAVTVHRQNGSTTKVWVGDTMLLRQEASGGGWLTDFTNEPPQPPQPEGYLRCPYCGEDFKPVTPFGSHGGHGCSAQRKVSARAETLEHEPAGDGIRTCLACGQSLRNGEMIADADESFHYDCH